MDVEFNKEPARRTVDTDTEVERGYRLTCLELALQPRAQHPSNTATDIVRDAAVFYQFLTEQPKDQPE